MKRTFPILFGMFLGISIPGHADNKPQLGIVRSNLVWETPTTQSKVIGALSQIPANLFRSDIRSVTLATPYAQDMMAISQQGKSILVLIEPDPEDYDNPNQIYGNGGQDFQNLCGWPQGATRYSTINLVRFKTRLQNYLSELKRLQVPIAGFEIGNEVDWVCFNGDIPWGRLPTDTETGQMAAQYGAFLEAAAQIIHQNYSGVPIVSFGSANVPDSYKAESKIPRPGLFLQKLRSMPQQSGSGNRFDLIDRIGVHLYPDPEAIADVDTILQTINTDTAVAGKPFWITEWGFRSNQFPTLSGKDRYQAFVEFYERMVQMPSLNVAALLNYSFDAFGDNLSLVSPDYQPLPEAQFFSQFTPVAGNTARFVGLDSTTQGNWPTAYGADGKAITSDVTAYPSYANVSITNSLPHVWNDSTSDDRALQKGSASDRIASTWYSYTDFTIDVNITDGLSHQVALYALDWDNQGPRQERIDVLDADSKVLLNSQTVSNFSQGQYLVWTIKGHVLFRVTTIAGGTTNAVVSGIFFGGAPVPTASVNFLKLDTTTQGNWKTAYGADGKAIYSDVQAYPNYANVSITNSLPYVWNPSTSDVRALQKGSATDRIASTWYSYTDFTIDANLTDGASHQVALYALDWDSQGPRQERIDVLDADSKVLLNSQTVSNFSQGQYLVWTIKGHVLFRVTTIAGGTTNAVVSGIFFGGPPVNHLPEGALESANCNTITGWAIDTDTLNSQISLHLYDGLAGPGGTPLGQYTTDVLRQNINDSYGATGNHAFSIPTPDILKDGLHHTLHVYAIDSTGGPNPLLADYPGLHTITCASNSSADFLKLDTTTQGNWKGTYGADGQAINGDVTNYPSSYAAVSFVAASPHVWDSNTSDLRALQKGSGPDRIASTWYSTTDFTIDVNLVDNNPHQVALYVLDWASPTPRQERIDVLDADSKVLLRSQTVSNFSQGQYLVWTIKGHVLFRVTTISGGTTNAVVSGIFFGGAGSSTQASLVTMNGRQLIVQKRQTDGSLAAPTPYVMKGINWDAATRAPATGPDPTLNGAQVPYGFFFDDTPDNRWRSPGLEGHDLLQVWLKQEFQTHYATDIPLMAQMNVNTVRVFTDFGTDPALFQPVLDSLYNHGIMVILTVIGGKADIDSGAFMNVVNLYKNHPAILMWSIGNEWNFNKLYGYPDMASAIAAVNQAAAQIKAIDPNHPVTSSLGDEFAALPTPCGPAVPNSDIPSIIAGAPNVDLWGLNVYRGSSFGDLFTRWTSVSPKPFYLSEFGTDSLRTAPGGYTQPFAPCKEQSAEAKVTSAVEDQAMQANLDIALWNEIKSHLSAVNTGNSCIGGAVFSFNDEVWKVGNYNVGLGGLVDAGDTSYNTYNPDGSYFLGGHPDNLDNAEYFGLLNADRIPKAAYTALQTAFAASVTSAGETQTPPTVTQSPLVAARVYPNPFRVDRGDTQITFDQIPANSTVKVFTVSAHWVVTLPVDSSGKAFWKLTNDSGDNVASGLYLYLVTDPQGNKTRGKFAVIR